MIREKHRWILFEVIGDKVTLQELLIAIRRKAYELFGTFGAAKIRFKIIEFDEEKGVGIMRINLDGLDLMRTLFLFLRKIDEKKIMLNDLLVSGTINALRKKAISRRTWNQITEEFLDKEDF